MLTRDQFIPIHAQVFLHPTEKGIVDISLVDVLQEVAQRSECQHKGIHLEEKPALICW